MYIAEAFTVAIALGAATVAGLNLRQKRQAKKALKFPSN